MNPPSPELYLTLSPAGTGAGYCAHVARGDGAAGLSATVAAFDLPHLEAAYLAPLRKFVERGVPAELLESLGRELAARLLPPPVRDTLLAALLACPDPAVSVRLRLRIEHPDLAGLPWEFARVDGGGAAGPEQFLALHARLHLVRQPEGGTRDVAEVAADPLRVLVAWADPRTPVYPPMPCLDAELRAILGALESGECRKVRVKELAHAAPAALRRSIEEWRPHVLHVTCHGDERPSGGVLVLQGAEPGAAAFLYGEDLAGRLGAAGTPLVVLSACRSASPVRGVAESLARAGVPAVVAMQLPLRDSTAGLFARAFYGALAEPCTVEEALRQARHAVRGAGPDWGVPVLYLGASDSRLFAPPEPAPPELPRTNLPQPPNPHFRGRERLLNEIHTRLWSADRRPVALTGMAGAGKSQLALEYAHRHLADYPDGVFWLNARDTARLLEDYAFLGHFFDIPETLSTRERAARVRDCLVRLPRPALLVADNVTPETELILPPSGRCRILFTTRAQFLAEQSHQIEVPVLEPDAALSLLQVYRPAALPEELEAADGIVRLVERLPLALALAAHQMKRRGLTFGQYRERLASNRAETMKEPRGPLYAGGVWDAIDLSHRSLTPAASALLAAAACFAGRGIPELLLFRTCEGLTPIECEDALGDLVGWSLATREEDHRVAVHELVRVYARGRLDPEELGATLDRVAAVLTGCLHEANERMEWRGVRREIAHCRTVASLFDECEHRKPPLALLSELGSYHFYERDLPAARGYLEEALKIADARSGALPDPEQARLLRELGYVLCHQEQHSDAVTVTRRALAMAREVYGPDAAETAECYNALGYVLKVRGHHWRALPFYQRALEINEQAYGCRHPNVATCKNNIGALLDELGQAESALDCLAQALAIDEAWYGSRHYRVAIRRNNIGLVLGPMGRWSDARELHRAALEIYEFNYHRRHLHVGMTLKYLGTAYAALGEREEAVRCFEEALPILEQHYGAGHRFCREVREALSDLESDSAGDPAGREGPQGAL